MDDGYPQIVMSGTDPNLPKEFTNSYAKYSQFKPMATGGKAELFSCWDNSLGRLVAVKTLRPEIAEDDFERRRFLREARVTAQLQHPNTVPVYEVGRANDGSLYFTMKRLLGEDLYGVVSRLQKRDPKTKRRYPITELVEVVLKASLALAYAHSHGVIHRDIKPENIWLGRFGEVLVLDWGVAKVWGQPDDSVRPESLLQQSDEADAPKSGEIVQPDAGANPDSGNKPDTSEKLDGNHEAKAIDEDAASASDDGDVGRLSTLTRSGSRPGTPLYMSPEQVAGHRYVDERTDIFSIGVVLYELLTLKLPFQGGDVVSTFEKIMDNDPVPPKTRSPARGISAPLERVTLKALQKNPQDRQQSMQLFMAELREALTESD